MSATSPSLSRRWQGASVLGRGVDCIELKLDEVLQETSDIRGDVADHETRLRALERARWPLPTITALAAVAAVVIALYRWPARATPLRPASGLDRGALSAFPA
ncbi:hypothetical protein [Streptomyces sp. NPDC051662]|uniref:hypothetical protein n=1 Tax=Streptomyces sp. NPDC051662 TaxID=3154750 RepID=UPI0034216C51